MTTCKTCGKRISKDAVKCPSCGHPSVGSSIDKLANDMIGAGFAILIIYLVVRYAL